MIAKSSLCIKLHTILSQSLTQNREEAAAQVAKCIRT